MASEDRSWPSWTRVALRLAILAGLVLVGAFARHRDTSSHATTSPPDTYTATFARKAHSFIHRGVDLYYFHDAVGHVTGTSIDADELVVRVAIDEDAAAKVRAMDPAFEVFRDRKHPSEGWIEMIPKDRNGGLMSPGEVARTWGRTASPRAGG
jgi:hypothetical protein